MEKSRIFNEIFDEMYIFWRTTNDIFGEKKSFGAY